jgi:hypothetical protein
MIELTSLGSIFAWAFFSFWSAIPAGIALKVTPIIVTGVVTLSYMASVLVVVIVGAPIRERILQRINDDAEPKRMVVMVQKAWQRFGLIGLSLLAPMTVGGQIGAVIGLSFGEKSTRLVIAMTLGAAVWAIVITLAVVAGVMTASQL